jgi:hypothetical protein
MFFTISIGISALQPGDCAMVKFAEGSTMIIKNRLATI